MLQIEAKPILASLIVALSLQSLSLAVVVDDVESLIAAINQGAAGDTIEIEAGTYVLLPHQRLIPKAGMTIRGQGMGKTVIEADRTWLPGIEGLPNETKSKAAKRDAFLFNIENTTDVTVADMTTKAPNLHGHMLLVSNTNTTLHHLKVIGSLWNGIQIFRQKTIVIHDCIFEDAGGKVKWLGGSIFQTHCQDADYYFNHIYRTSDKKYVGFKSRGTDRNCRIHHNTVGETGKFSFEWPHSYAENIEIDHNRFAERISIPKGPNGAPVDGNGYSYWIHHNWFQGGPSEVFEGPRSSLRVAYNLFDLSTEQDGGNLLTDHSKKEITGPVVFHDNLVKNPGRGLFWSVAKYNQFTFTHNHVIAHKTVTPRTDGLFGFSRDSDFGTIEISNNIIECIDQARPLFRNDESGVAKVENNTLMNITDLSRYQNPDTDAVRGPRKSLYFLCGSHCEWLVDGWNAGPRGIIDVREP